MPICCAVYIEQHEPKLVYLHMNRSVEWKTMEHSAKCQENCLRFIFDDIIRWRAFVRQRFHRSDFSLWSHPTFSGCCLLCHFATLPLSTRAMTTHRLIRTRNVVIIAVGTEFHQFAHNSNEFENWTKNIPLIIMIIIFINGRRATEKYLHWAKLCENSGLPKLNWIWFNINAKIMWWLHAFGHRRLLMLGWCGIYRSEEREEKNKLMAMWRWNFSTIYFLVRDN